MSDTPPPELVDACARAELNWDERLSIEEGGEEPWLAAAPDDREVYREGVRRILAALAEWAGSGFIDPSTWTVVEAKKVARVVVDAWSLTFLPMEMHAELTDPADCCDGDPLWLLSPREGER